MVPGSPTSYNDPFNLARRLASLELISGGRSGWKERGIVRSEYSATTLRGNLGLPVPENRYTRARFARGSTVADAAVPGTTELAGRN